MILPNKVFDFLKWFTLIFMPALITFVGVIFGCIHMDPEITNVVITIMSGFTTFLGAILGISTVNYRKEK
jgi:hypothetical protein